MEIQLENYRIELDATKNAKSKETRNRMELEKMNQDLEKNLNIKERELKSYIDELNHQRFTNDKLIEDNEKLFNELEKLKNHILILTDQNSKVILNLNYLVD